MPQRDCFRLATTLHGTDITVVGADRGMHDAVRLVINKSDGVTAVSQYLKDETVKMFSPKQEIEVIHNFVDTEVFRRIAAPDILRQLVPGKGKTVIHISNFRPVKRISDIVSVFHRLTQQLDATLLMVGDGLNEVRQKQRFAVWV